MIVVGIDPGLSGAISVCGLSHTDDRRVEYVTTYRMPVRKHFSGKGKEIDAKSFAAVVNSNLMLCGGVSDFGGSVSPAAEIRTMYQEPIGLVVIEHVGNLTRRDEEGGLIKMGATGMFSFGDGFGKIRAVCEIKNWPIHYVRPQVWQKEIFAGKYKKGESKKLAIAFAQDHYPRVKIQSERMKNPHTGMADSLCLMEFGKRLLRERESVAAGFGG